MSSGGSFTRKELIPAKPRDETSLGGADNMPSSRFRLLPWTGTPPGQTLAGQKVSLRSSLLRHWSGITGERLWEGAGACLEVTPLAPPEKPAPTVGEWLQLHGRG
jgi:hypothetical protein